MTKKKKNELSRVQVMVPDELHNRLRRLQEDSDEISLSSYCRRVLQDHANQQPKPKRRRK